MPEKTKNTQERHGRLFELIRQKTYADKVVSRKSKMAPHSLSETEMLVLRQAATRSLGAREAPAPLQ